MATEKQIRANRANAARSTGPRTAAGKRKSSGNAFRHGLSGATPLDPPNAATIELIARQLAGEHATEGRLASASEYAGAQLELLRIRAIRTDLFSKVDIMKGSNPEEIARLAALDRYERYALTRRRRASKELNP